MVEGGILERSSERSFERSLEQRLRALQRANEVRSRRAELKCELKDGSRVVGEVLLEPAAELETMKVFELLLAAPKFGRVKVSKILSQHRISPSKTIGGLSERQRRELVMHLRYGRPSRVL